MRSTGLISMEFQGTQGNFTDKRYQVRVNSSEGSNTRETTEGNSIMDPPPPQESREKDHKASPHPTTWTVEKVMS